MSFKPDLEAPQKDERTNRAVKKSQFDPKGLIHKNYDVQSPPIQMRARILYLANLWMDFKMLFTTNIFL